MAKEKLHLTMEKSQAFFIRFILPTNSRQELWSVSDRYMRAYAKYHQASSQQQQHVDRFHRTTPTGDSHWQYLQLPLQPSVLRQPLRHRRCYLRTRQHSTVHQQLSPDEQHVDRMLSVKLQSLCSLLPDRSHKTLHQSSSYQPR